MTIITDEVLETFLSESRKPGARPWIPDPSSGAMGFASDFLEALAAEVRDRRRADKRSRAQKMAGARAARMEREISEHKAWMVHCGGTLEGYVKNYGSKEDPDHGGDGGEAIYKADLEHLARLEVELSKSRKGLKAY